MNTTSRKHPRGNPISPRRHAAFTFIELMIAVSVFTLVMGGVAALQYISARGIKEIYEPTASRAAREIALAALHLELANAKQGSAAVSNSNHTITFINPNRCTATTVTSQFVFNPTQKTLTFSPDKTTTANSRIICRGPVDISFTLGSRLSDPLQTTYFNPTALITLYVRTQANLAYSNVDNRDGECVVYMRNP